MIAGNTSAKSVNALLVKAYQNKIHLVLSFVLLTAVAAHIVIPTSPVPFTLQTLAVLLSGAILGAKRGAYAQITYVLAGVAGLPVFAHTADGTVGLMSLFGPTGGYLLAFPVGAFLTGKIAANSKSFFTTLLAFVVGELVIITTGVLFLNTFYLHDIMKSLVIGAGLFSVWTLAKIVLGTAVSALYKNYKK